MRYWMKGTIIAGALLLAPTLAHAQSRVDQLSAGAAVSATDTLPNCQSCGASTPLVSTTFTQVMTFIKAQANAWSGAQTFLQVKETAIQLGSGSCTGTINIDLSLGSYFYCSSTGTTTFTVTNPAAAGLVSAFTFELTNGGAHTQNFMSGTKWPGGTVPTWTTSGIDLFVCSTRDAATTWRCVESEADSR